MDREKGRGDRGGKRKEQVLPRYKAKNSDFQIGSKIGEIYPSQTKKGGGKETKKTNQMQLSKKGRQVNWELSKSKWLSSRNANTFTHGEETRNGCRGVRKGVPKCL